MNAGLKQSSEVEYVATHSCLLCLLWLIYDKQIAIAQKLMEDFL